MYFNNILVDLNINFVLFCKIVIFVLVKTKLIAILILTFLKILLFICSSEVTKHVIVLLDSLVPCYKTQNIFPVGFVNRILHIAWSVKNFGNIINEIPLHVE